MSVNVNEEVKSLPTTGNNFIGRKKLIKIIVEVCIIVAIIIAAVVATVIILKKKDDTSSKTTIISDTSTKKTSTKTTPVEITKTTVTKTTTTTTTRRPTTTTTTEYDLTVKDNCPKNYSHVYSFPDDVTIISMFSTDLNHDNWPDIIVLLISTAPVANENSTAWIDVFLNNGDNTFTVQTIFKTNAGTSCCIHMTKIHDNTNLNIILWDYYTRELYLLFQNDNINFTVQKISHMEKTVGRVAAADLNNDNRSDLVTTHFNLNYITIFFNTDDGMFTKQQRYSCGNSLTLLSQIVDINKDGSQDLILSCSYDSDLLILFNDGNGRFLRNKTISVRHRPALVIAVDINNDDRLDLIVRSEVFKSISIYLNMGKEEFAYSKTYSTVLKPMSIAVGDFNNDKRLDILVMTIENIVLFLNANNGFFIGTRNKWTESSVYILAVNDMNADGQIDIIVGYSSSIGIVYIYCK